MTANDDIPAWAESLVELVMAHEGMPRPPLVEWTARPLPVSGGHRASNSSGMTCGNLIAVYQGASEQDARHTLFHELAHWVTESGHTQSMYAKMFELLWLFGEPGDLDYAKVRESEYQPAAAQQGWSRFSARVNQAVERAEVMVERVLSNPVSRLIMPVIGAILGVDSLQHIE